MRTRQPATGSSVFWPERSTVWERKFFFFKFIFCFKLFIEKQNSGRDKASWSFQHQKNSRIGDQTENLAWSSGSSVFWPERSTVWERTFFFFKFFFCFKLFIEKQNSGRDKASWSFQHQKNSRIEDQTENLAWTWSLHGHSWTRIQYYACAPRPRA